MCGPRATACGYDRAVLIPLGTERPTRRPSVVTPTLIVVTVVAHVVALVLLRADPARGDWLYATLSVGGSEFRWWGLFSSLLLHSPETWLHLIANMLFLWVFGPSVEDRYGRAGFLALYLLGGAASGGLHAAFEASPAIGASGAIAAVAGAFLVLFPRTRIKCFWIFTLSVIPVPAWWFIGLAVAWDLLAHAFQTDDSIARLAHLAGGRPRGSRMPCAR